MNSQLQQQGLPMRGYSNVMAAAHRTVHHAIKGGAETLAPELGITPATLSNQVNYKQAGHKFGLEDSIYIQLRTHNFETLLQYAAALGHTIVPIGDFSGVSDIELLSVYSEWHAELGDVNKAVKKAFKDGKLTRKEFDRIEKEYIEAVAAGQVFLSRCRALIDEE